jgi:hypothetical protein
MKRRTLLKMSLVAPFSFLWPKNAASKPSLVHVELMAPDENGRRLAFVVESSGCPLAVRQLDARTILVSDETDRVYRLPCVPEDPWFWMGPKSRYAVRLMSDGSCLESSAETIEVNFA